MAWCHVCLLDLRQFGGKICKVLDQIRRVRASFETKVVIFMLSFPGERREVEIWREVLKRKFSTATGNVKQYHMDETDPGQAILCFGNVNTDVRILYVDFLQPIDMSPDVTFGNSMIYLELVFRKAKSVSKEVVGILWVPDLFYSRGYILDGGGYLAAVHWVRTTMAMQRKVSLVPEEVDVDVDKALRAVEQHLSGLLVITDLRSEHFTDAFPAHNWHMSGNMHAVPGTVVAGGFRDAMANEKLDCLPVCYKVKPMKKPYHVPHHSCDFWFGPGRGSQDLSGSCSGEHATPEVEGGATTTTTTTTITTKYYYHYYYYYYH